MVSIAYQTEFTNCKRLLSIYANVGGIGTDDALELYEKLFNLYVKCENCEKPCCTR